MRSLPETSRRTMTGVEYVLSARFRIACIAWY
jgi:hypothetical protein